jgi:hypothetical protein
MIDVLKSLIKQFMPFAQQQMGFSRPPKLFLRQDEENGANPLGKTGFYDPQDEAVTLYISGRHPKDIMRSLAHELQHHTQKCNGDFENVQNMGEEGYAQADPHMRTMEIQAYQASIVFRDWEDSTKGTIYYEHLQKGDNVSMSTKNWKNGELKSLLSEAWGFKMDLSKLNEGAGDAAVRKRCGEDGSGCTAEEAQAIYNKAEHGSGDPGRMEAGSLEEENQLDEYSGSGAKRGPGDKGEEEEAKKETEGEETSKREEEDLDEGFADASSGPAPRKPRRMSGGAGAADDCNPKTDPTCVPEPSEDAVADSIASRMNKKDLEESDMSVGAHKAAAKRDYDMDEGCGDHGDPGGMEMMAMGDEMGAPDDPGALAAELASLAQRIGDLLGGTGGAPMMTGAEGDEELEERRARGRKGPSTRQEDPRLRESVVRLHKAGYSKHQIKEFLTKAYSKALRS